MFDDAVYRMNTDGGGRTSLATTDTAYGSGLLAGFTVDGQYAYWTEPYGGSNNVKRVSRDGGGQSVVTVGPSEPTSLTVVGNRLYFVSRGNQTDNAGGVNSVSADGIGLPSSLVSGQNNPAGLVIDGAYMYWCNEGSVWASVAGGNGGLTTDGAVLRCTLAGCAVPEVLASNQKNAFAIAQDAKAIYWTAINDGNIMKLAK